MKVRISVAWILLILLSFTACKNASNPQDKLVKTWLVTQSNCFILDSNQAEEKWQLSSDFSLQISNKTNTILGKWSVEKGKLLFELTPNDSIIKIDSTSVSLVNGKQQTILFSSGVKVATVVNGITQREPKKHLFKVIKIENNQLTLSNNNYTFNLKCAEITKGINQLNLGNMLRGLLGLIILVGISILFSFRRRAIPWRLVVTGILIQIVFAVLVFEVPFIKHFFEYLASFFVVVLEFTKSGSNFLFGGLLDTKNVGYLFAFQVLPTIIFFSALTSLLYYLGILQKIVYAIAWLMNKTMKLSGAESLSTAANIFLGQTEAPLMVKPYIAGMTRSEILCIMIGGMASIAGGVLAAYVGFLGGPDPEQQKLFATHLLTASILSAPATIVVSKILLPETEPINENLDLPKQKIGVNLLEAITTGTTDGVKLAINVGAMLLVFTALVAMLNYILFHGIGEWTGVNALIQEHSLDKSSGLSVQWILGYIFSPLAFIIGIPSQDIQLAGQLLGEKTVLNEFYAYTSLSKLKDAGSFVHAQTVIILTYALCGFANFASVGIQIGGIGTMAPNQRKNLAQLGLKALLGGTLACLMTACIAGMFF